jgi:hypothetical protein
MQKGFARPGCRRSEARLPRRVAPALATDGPVGLLLPLHASVLERAGLAGLAEGQRVAVDVALGSKGPEAAGLRLI